MQESFKFQDSRYRSRANKNEFPCKVRANRYVFIPMSHPEPVPGSAPAASKFNAESVRNGLRRIVTSTHLRGFGRIHPNPHHKPGHVPTCNEGGPEGPAIALHGLAATVASTPLHFVAILEPGERIAISRIGFHRSRLQVLFGRCRLTCVDLESNREKDHEHPVRTWNPKARAGMGTIHFPLELVATPSEPHHVGELDAGDFPEDDRYLVCIESLDGASVLLSSRTKTPPGGGCCGGDTDASRLAAEPVAAWDVNASSSCSPSCITGCPHGLTFAGQMSPPAHHK